MTAVIICNPAAGGGRSGRRLRQLLAATYRPSELPLVQYTSAPGDAAALASRARDEGFEEVIAAGGDGTVHEVVNGLLAGGPRPVPGLGVLPLGTGCDFVRNLGQRVPVGEVLGALATAPVRTVDVGRVRAATTDGAGMSRFFVNAVNIGLGPRVARRVQTSRWMRPLGAASYGVAAVAVMMTFQHDELSCEADGHARWRGPVLNLSVCNGAYCGGGMRVSETAGLETSSLSLVRLGPMKLLPALVQLGRAMGGRAPCHPRVHVLESGRLEIEGEGDIEVDGELPGRLPASFEIVPRTLRVRAPGWSPDPITLSPRAARVVSSPRLR